MASSLDAFIGKLDIGARKDLSQLHGTCWDEDDVILRCRNCQAEFSLILRKHHCRSCGGIYCDACNPAGAAQIAASPSSPMSEGVDEEGYYMGKYVGRKNPRRRSDVSEASANSTTSSPAAPAAGASVAPAVPVAKEEGFWLGKFLGRPNPKGGPPSAQPPKKGPDDGARYCLGCRMAETPCERVKTILKDKYVSVMATRSEPRPPSRQLTLSRGSLYGETSKVMQRTDGREAHKSGYIEILNKGDFVFCVKMFTGQSDIFRESSRPSYIAVYPDEVVYVEVEPSVGEVDVAILYGNRNRPKGEPPVRGVREYLAEHPDELPNSSVVSECALVENFAQLALYTIDVDGKNAILKYQGQGVLDIRKGTTSNLARGTGHLFKGMLGSAAKAHNSTLDMASNTDTLIEVFRCDQY